MKKRNIGICIITTTLLMGGPAKATELILAKDHTNVVNQAAEIAAYKSNRPPVNKRLFKSKAVEAESMPCGYVTQEHRFGLIYN